VYIWLRVILCILEFMVLSIVCKFKQKWSEGGYLFKGNWKCSRAKQTDWILLDVGKSPLYIVTICVAFVAYRCVGTSMPATSTQNVWSLISSKVSSKTMHPTTTGSHGMNLPYLVAENKCRWLFMLWIKVIAGWT